MAKFKGRQEPVYFGTAVTKQPRVLFFTQDREFGWEDVGQYWHCVFWLVKWQQEWERQEEYYAKAHGGRTFAQRRDRATLRLADEFPPFRARWRIAGGAVAQVPVEQVVRNEPPQADRLRGIAVRNDHPLMREVDWRVREVDWRAYDEAVNRIHRPRVPDVHPPQRPAPVDDVQVYLNRLHAAVGVREPAPAPRVAFCAVCFRLEHFGPCR